MNFWSDVKLGLSVVLPLLLLLTLVPVALTGGVFATKCLYCDKLHLCQEVKK